MSFYFCSCINDPINLNFNLTSNYFYKNNAMNGGAIFFSNLNTNEGSDKDINELIYIENNVFEKNKAISYGGAIHLEFNKLRIEKYNNNNITNNEAGVLGGGVYLNKNISFNMYNLYFKNNKVGSLDNNYSSQPSFISLNNTIENNIINVNAGNNISLKFDLKDIFNKIITDQSNYYSVIILKLILFNKYNNSTTNNKYKILGNFCNFYEGIWEKILNFLLKFNKIILKILINNIYNYLL